MRSDTLFPRLTASERGRLIDLARAEAARLRAQAIHDAWAALFRAAAWLAKAGWRGWRHFRRGERFQERPSTTTLSGRSPGNS